MKNKTILMIAYYFPPAAGVGTFRITKFCKYLKKLGYNPIIVTVEEENYLNKDNSLMEDLKDIPRYNIKLLKRNKDKTKDFYYSALKQIEDIISKTEPKYAFLTGGPFYYLKLGPILYKKFNIKYIIDLRDPWSLQKTMDGNILQKTKNKLYKKYARYLENNIFRYASYVTTVNNTMTEEYKKTFPKYENKIITIPNAIDLEDYINEKGFKFSNYTILYAGKFSTSSGFRDPSLFLKVLKNINSKNENKIKFIHIGEKEKEIIDIVNELQCQSFVEFYGNCSYKKTISYCKGADILLILSTKEKCEQTGKIYDYLGCGNKILAITNQNNEIFKICQKNKIVVADPKDENDIETKLKELIKKDKIVYQTENFETREKTTKKLIELLEQIK